MAGMKHVLNMVTALLTVLCCSCTNPSDAAYGPYSVIFLPDCHLCNDAPRKNDLALFDSLAMTTYRRLYDSLIVSGPVYTIGMGDLSHDRYWYVNEYDFKKAYSHLLHAGIQEPFYCVKGNHDHDPLVTGTDPEMVNLESEKQFRQLCGPDAYSFDICGDHWVIMDNMKYINTPDPGSRIKGVKGRRDYSTSYSSSQLDWFAKDLTGVPQGSAIYMCSHAPLFDMAGIHLPSAQLKTIDSLLAARNLTLEFFAGHAHRMENAFRPEYPNIRVHVLPAVSGNMWECVDGHIVGLDGTEGGLAVWHKDEHGKSGLCYECYEHRSDLCAVVDSGVDFRAYDMNSLARHWASDDQCRWILDAIDRYVDYTDPCYRNGVLVNCWSWSEGDTVEIMEDGRPLEVMNAPFSVDPVSLESHFTFRRDKYKGGHYNPRDLELDFSHLFYAQRTRTDSEITVRVVSD